VSRHLKVILRETQFHAVPGSRLLWLFMVTAFMSSPVSAADCVLLLHGLARTSASMEKLAKSLENNGYQVANVDYPSRHHAVEELAPLAVDVGLESCGSSGKVHFVTHSLGGILVRYYLKRQGFG